MLITNRKLDSSTESVRSKETTFANFVADIFKDTFNAEIAIIKYVLRKKIVIGLGSSSTIHLNFFSIIIILIIILIQQWWRNQRGSFLRRQ